MNRKPYNTRPYNSILFFQQVKYFLTNPLSISINLIDKLAINSNVSGFTLNLNNLLEDEELKISINSISEVLNLNNLINTNELDIDITIETDILSLNNSIDQYNLNIIYELSDKQTINNSIEQEQLGTNNLIINDQLSVNNLIDLDKFKETF